MFNIRMGIPEMKEFWDDLIVKKKNDNLNTDEEELFKRLAKSIKFLSVDPKHPSLQTHEIGELSKKYNMKIWQSYIDQGKTARRIFWTYGPNRKEITILGIEPHPEDKKRGAYKRIKLSDLPS
ncbi:MAG: hypothetical protein JJU46_08815 [Balneolaceae bacterium]|nr:hypothetical protein [Balneolaceae bacterium]